MTDIEKTIAPHVEPAWAEAVLLELRLQGVSGKHIGAVLAEVDAHLAESGESSQEAFGDPVAYARSLRLPPSPKQSRSAIAINLVPILLQLLGMFLVLSAMPWGAAPVGVSPALLAGLALTVLTLSAVVIWSEQLLRWIVSRAITAFLVFIAGFAAVAGIGVLIARQTGALEPWFELPRLSVLITGCIALIAGGLAALPGTAESIDVITSPVPGKVLPRPRLSRIRLWVWSALPVPVLTAVAAVLLTVFGAPS